MENVKGQSRSKVKATLQGRGVLVNGKVVTQFDAPLKPGMTVSVSKRKRDDELRNRYVRIVYEDPYLVNWLIDLRRQNFNLIPELDGKVRYCNHCFLYYLKNSPAKLRN